MQSGRTKSSEQHVRHGLAAVVALTLAIAAAWQAGFTRLAAHSAMNAAVFSVSDSSRQAASTSESGSTEIELNNSVAPVRAVQVAGPTVESGVVIDLATCCKAGLIALPPPAC